MVACGLMMLGVVDGLSPQALAVEAEARGFESVFFPEHTHVPVGRPTIRFGDRALPDWYSHLLDPFVALTAAAMATERIKVGTCVCLVAEHDPIALAKTVATLDVISGGRFIFGVGAGWNDLELADHGVAYADRWAVTRENVLAMREMWTAEEAAFSGRFVEFGPLLSWPKPVAGGRAAGAGGVAIAVDVGSGGGNTAMGGCRCWGRMWRRSRRGWRLCGRRRSGSAGGRSRSASACGALRIWSRRRR